MSEGESVYYQKNGSEYYGVVSKIKKNGTILIDRNGKRTHIDEIQGFQWEKGELHLKSGLSEGQFMVSTNNQYEAYDRVQYHFKVKGELRCVDAYVISSFANGKTLILSQELLERGYVAKIFASTEELQKSSCEDQQPNHGLEKYAHIYY